MKKIMFGVMAIEVIIIAIVFATVPFDFGDDLWWLTLAIPAAIIGITLLTLLPFVRMTKTFDEALRQFSGKPDKEFADAPIGIATVLDVSMSGMSINDIQQYELTVEVETLDGQVFSALCKQLIPPQELAGVTAGLMVPVTYRPDRPGVVHLVGVERMAEAQSISQQLRIRKGLSDPESMIISSQGTAAIGVILSALPTGEIRRGHTGMDLAVAVTRPDGGQFTGHKISYLLPRQLGAVQPGRQVQVHYLAHDESKFALSVPANA